MSFLSQTFLFALPLALVPIVFHLINRTQREVINWGAMQFLTEATVEGSRFQRLEELLLLACRVGLVLALVLALARPLLKTTLFGSSPRRDVVLILDNSLSTDLKVGTNSRDRSVYEQMKERAARVLDDLSAGDQVRVMLTTDGPSWLQSEPVMRGTRGYAELKKRLARSQPTLAKTKIRRSVQAVLDSYVDSTDKDLPRSIVLLTDGQAESWEVDAINAWQGIGKLLESYNGRPVGVEVIFPDKVPGSISNVSVAEVSSRSSFVRRGNRVVFQARVVNHGNTEQFDIGLNWSINGEPQKESVIDKLSPGESRELEWATQLDETGSHRIGCELNVESIEDQLQLDNYDYRIVEVIDRVPILVVRAASAYETSNGHIFFAAALGYGEEAGEGSWQSAYEPTTISIAGLDSITLGDYQTIILSDATLLPSHVIEQLMNYVHEGGGLWVALGSRVDKNSFNAVWYDEGTGLSPWQLTKLVSQEPQLNRDVADEMPMIHQPDPNHPATATLANTGQVDLDKVRIWKRYTFTDEDEPRPFTSLLESGRGEPLVLENAYGNGRVIFQTFPMGVRWSNLPLTRAYVVMIHDWLDYLTEPAATQYNLEPSTPIRLPRGVSKDADLITVRPAVGEPFQQSGAELNSVSRFRYRQTQLPGRYEVDVESSEGTSTHHFQVRKDPSESRLKQLSQQQREKLTRILGADFGGDPHEASLAVAEANSKPAWSWFLIGLLFLVAAEQFLASRLNQQRFGSSLR